MKYRSPLSGNSVTILPCSILLANFRDATNAAPEDKPAIIPFLANILAPSKASV